MPAAAQNTKPQGSETAREKLLEAASDLMTERGSTDISLSDIAGRSGQNSALVKYYFGNKSGLFIELLRRDLGPRMDQLRHLTAMEISPEEKLRLHITGIVNAYYKHPYVNRLMHDLMADDDEEQAQIIVNEFSKPIANAQKKILREGLKAGVFRKVDPMLFFYELIGACDHLFFGRYSLKYAFSIARIDEKLKDRYIKHLFEVAIRGIQAD